MDHLFNRSDDKSKRQSLRNQAPMAEQLLWSRLRNKQLFGCKFRRQFGVGPFVIDFYSVDQRLGIEVDGESHFEPGAAEKDLFRTRFIEQQGIQLIRSVNTEIFENLDGVIQVIGEVIEQRRTRKSD